MIMIIVESSGIKQTTRCLCASKRICQNKSRMQAVTHLHTIFFAFFFFYCRNNKCQKANMKVTWIFIVLGALLLVNSAEGGASLVRSMGLRGSQQSLPESGNLRGGQEPQSRASYFGSPVYNGGKSSNVAKSQGKTERGLGISAWGIIGIIVGVILLTTMGYYTFVLYPYVCKKQQSYDMIELTNVV